jgi:glucose-6-phosphate-specific signal transduction histidine kinase
MIKKTFLKKTFIRLRQFFVRQNQDLAGKTTKTKNLISKTGDKQRISIAIDPFDNSSDNITMLKTQHLVLQKRKRCFVERDFILVEII